MLQYPEQFVGRKQELRAIISRMEGSQPTSLNIVGEHQIGKSSLLYHFFQTWEQRVSQPENYVVIYLSLQNANCQKEKDFYQAVAQELLSCSSVRIQPDLVALLQKTPLDRLAFSQAIKGFKKLGVLPVLCLDDFESLFANRNEDRKEFDNGFYDNLRSLMDNNALMLIIASCKELEVHANEQQFTSSFFNVGHVIKLSELTTDEAIQLTRLPVNSLKKTSALTKEEQNLAQQWGNRHPYLLQLAAYYLCEARQERKDFQWAKRQFEHQVSIYYLKLKRHPRYTFSWLLIIVFSILIIILFLFITTTSIPILSILGGILGGIGKTLDTLENIAHIIIGSLIFILLVLSLTGVMPWEEVKNYLLKWMKK